MAKELDKQDILTYFEKKSNAVSKVDFLSVQKLFQALVSVSNTDSRCFILGNGGSAATAEHFVTDLGIGSFIRKTSSIRAISLSSNIPVLTAIANDVGYSEVFSRQIELMSPNPTDLLIAISASGNSPNVVKAIRTAKKMKLNTCAFTGFDGGIASRIVDISIHVPTKKSEYGIVEDIHMSLCHFIAEMLRR